MAEVTPTEQQFFAECLKVAPRDRCEMMWSPATRPSDWDVFWAWMEINGLNGPLVFIIFIAAACVIVGWKFRNRKTL